MLVNAGPVMLLEVCEATLKDWLSENRTVTADMLEDILIFALDIARGVEFLHRQQVNSVVFFVQHHVWYELMQAKLCGFCR